MEEYHQLIMRLYALKGTSRAAWNFADVSDGEDVAGHTWGVAFLTLLLGERTDIDVDHAVKLALVHDIAEADVGDIITADKYPDSDKFITPEQKHALESDAMDEVFEDFSENHIRELWDEYEAKETEEARFVKDMDTLDVCYQSYIYQKNGELETAEEPYDSLHDDILEKSRGTFYTTVAEDLFNVLYEKAEQ